MSITVILEMNAKPESVDDLLGLMKEILPDTRGFPGCNGIQVCQNQEDPTNLVFVESWEQLSDYDKYRAWRAESNTMGSIGAFLAGPPKMRHFDITDV